VLYKYVNPSTALVITGPQGSAMSAGGGVVAHWLDTVTGRLLVRHMHEFGRGPAVAVVAENWGVYQIWDANAQRCASVSKTPLLHVHIIQRACRAWLCRMTLLRVCQGLLTPAASSFCKTTVARNAIAAHAPVQMCRVCSLHHRRSL
jgi:hypothetical protein